MSQRRGNNVHITYWTRQQQQQYSQNIRIKKNLLQTTNQVSAAEQSQVASYEWATMAEATKSKRPRYEQQRLDNTKSYIWYLAKFESSLGLCMYIAINYIAL